MSRRSLEERLASPSWLRRVGIRLGLLLPVTRLEDIENGVSRRYGPFARRNLDQDIARLQARVEALEEGREESP